MNRTAVRIAGIASMLLGGFPVFAEDEPDELIPGKVIVVKPGKHAKVVARLAPGQVFTLPSAANDPTTEGATLTFFDTAPGGGGEVSYELDASGWKALGKAPGSKGFKYTGRRASPADHVCRRVLLKRNVLKAVCKGDAASVPLSTPFSGDAAVVLTVGSNSKRYCALFGGAVRRNDLNLLKRTGAAAPLTCVDAGTPTPTATATSTPTPTSTLTPTPTPTLGSDIDDSVCSFGAGSSIQLTTVAFPIPPLSMEGLAGVDLSCGSIDAVSLEAPCSCVLDSSFSVPLIAIGFLCFEPAGPCDDGFVDCDGSDPIGLDLDANHNIGTCTDNSDCAGQCTTHCSPLEAESGCEGFCSDGPSACTVDADCAGLGEGICQGREPVGHANACWCRCLDRQTGSPAAPGSLQCNLGYRLRLRESDCTSSPVIFDLGERCLALTTGVAVAELVNGNNQSMSSIGPVMTTGSPVSCNVLQTGVASGMSLVGNDAPFDSTIGDIIGQMILQCE